MKYFGTDGIRGQFGDDKINEAFFEKLGLSASCYLNGKENKKIVIGGDTRASSEVLKNAFCKGARNVEIIDMGTVSTPLLAYGTRVAGAALGVMITASHNPYTDNGIKFFDHKAHKIDDDTQLEIEKYVDTPPAFASSLAAAKIVKDTSAKAKYIAHMLTLLPAGCLKGMKVVLDMAHGGTVGISSEVLKGYGAELYEIGAAPDGKNINFEVGSEHAEAMQQMCAKVGASIGFAHDGDGDRLVVCDEKSSIVSGEEVMGLIAFACDDANELSSKAIVTTLQSNLGLDEALAKRGIKTLRSGIGDRLVMQMMIENSCNMGGENSGHYIFSDISPCGDGLAAAIKLLSILIRSKKPLSELRQVVKLYPICQSAIKVVRKTPLEQTPTLSKAMAKCEEMLKDKGRILVRYSGTENKIRLLVESPSEALNEECFALLKNGVENDLQ